MWNHKKLVLVLGSDMFMTVIVLPLIVLFISIGKLWILFLSVVATLVIVLVDYQVEYFQYTFDY